MRKTLLAMTTALCAFTMSAAVTPVDLPDGITVSPEQGVVDVSANANPLGVTEISFTFPDVPEVNSAATGNFCIYVDGSETAAEELPVAGNAKVDALGYPMGSFTFKHIYKEVGSYRITVPAGVWTYGGKTSPAMTLNYEIQPGVESYPAAGVVSELTEISLTVPGVDKLSVDAENISFFTMAKDIEFNAVADGNEIFITPKNLDDVNANDTYYLVVGEGAVTWKDGDTDMSNLSTQFQYVKTDIPKPSISPGEGPIEAFGNFTITFPEGFKAGMIDNMSWSYLYPEKDGKMLSDPALRYKVKKVDDTAVFYPVDEQGNEITEPVELPAGAYTFVPAANYAFGEWKENPYASIPPYKYNFRVEAKVDPNNCFVKGTVTLPDGKPAAGAGVTISDDGDYYQYATADENGLYVVSTVPADPTSSFNVSAFDAEWIYSYQATAKFTEPKNNVYDIVLQAAAEGYELNVTVAEDSGATISGATVKVNKLEESATTDEMGVCYFVIPTETGVEGLSVTVTKEGYEEKTENVTWTEDAESMDITVVLAKTGGIDGIEADSEVRYYNLQGVRIDAPAKGEVIIRVANGKASKVVGRN